MSLINVKLELRLSVMSKIKLHTDDYIFTSRQRSCGKVMSSDVSVCNSVHRGWGPYTGPLAQPPQTCLTWTSMYRDPQT